MMLSPTLIFIDRHHLLVAHVVVQSQRSTVVPIRVFNPGAASVTLKRGTVAGVLLPAMVLEEVRTYPVKATNQFPASVHNHLQVLYERVVPTCLRTVHAS